MSNAARMFTVVVASGTSTRYGSNKLKEYIGSETVLDLSVKTALQVSDGVIVVTDPQNYTGPEVYAVVSGGSTRSESVKNGLNAVPKEIEIIAIHDAARPGVSKEIYLKGKSLIEQGHLGAIPCLKVVDTIKQVDPENEELIAKTVERDQLRAVQTPQIFKSEIIREAHDRYESDTDDSALVEKLNISVSLFEGSEKSRKVTTPADLIFLKEVLDIPKTIMPNRIGTGYDIHPFGEDENKKLVLAGIEFDHVGLAGHSDSDAVSHALTDALLSAVGEPDLGTLFPASDNKNKGLSSIVFLENAVLRVSNLGYRLTNVSIIVNAQKPKLSGARDDMIKRLAEAMEPIMCEQTIISITPKHGEGIGEIGQGQAIAVYATVQLSQIGN